MKMLRVVIVLIFISVLFSACSSNNRVQVLKGDGLKTKGFIKSINQVGQGEIKAFFGATNKLLIKNQNQYSSIDLSTNAKTEILTPEDTSEKIVQISPDGNRMMIGNTLIDSVVGSKKELTKVSNKMRDLYQQIAPFPSYTFLSDGSIYLTDPYYYLEKSQTSQIFASLVASNFPKFKSIKDPQVLLDKMQVLFIGTLEDGKSSLYMGDVSTQQLKNYGENVRTYALSPDFRKVSWVEAPTQNSIQNKIWVMEIAKEVPKAVLSLDKINNLVWIGRSSWLIYSKGDTDQSDLFVLKEDGSINEQLTINMKTTGKIIISRNGELAAFQAKNKSEIYTIALEIPVDPKQSPAAQTQPQLDLISKTILEKLKEETALFLQ